MKDDFESLLERLNQSSKNGFDKLGVSTTQLFDLIKAAIKVENSERKKSYIDDMGQILISHGQDIFWRKYINHPSFIAMAQPKMKNGMFFYTYKNMFVSPLEFEKSGYRIMRNVQTVRLNVSLFLYNLGLNIRESIQDIKSLNAIIRYPVLNQLYGDQRKGVFKSSSVTKLTEQLTQIFDDMVPESLGVKPLKIDIKYLLLSVQTAKQGCINIKNENYLYNELLTVLYRRLNKKPYEIFCKSCAVQK